MDTGDCHGIWATRGLLIAGLVLTNVLAQLTNKPVVLIRAKKKGDKYRPLFLCLTHPK